MFSCSVRVAIEAKVRVYEMKEDIISQKIRRELSNLPIDTEPRVMYLLVEIRKVFDHEETKDSVLRFYANWVVHTRLNKPWVEKVLNMISKDNGIGSSMRAFYKIREELKCFIVKHDLPMGLVNKDSNWIPFRESLLNILIDTPIEKIKNVGKDKIVVASFTFQRRSSGIEFCVINEKGSERLGRIIL